MGQSTATPQVSLNSRNTISLLQFPFEPPSMAIVSPSSSSYENESLKEMIVAVGGAENLGAETPPSRVREANPIKIKKYPFWKVSYDAQDSTLKAGATIQGGQGDRQALKTCPQIKISIKQNKKDYTEMVKGFRTAGYNLTPVRPYTQICTLAYTNPCFHFIFLATKNSFLINSLIAEQECFLKCFQKKKKIIIRRCIYIYKYI